MTNKTDKNSNQTRSRAQSKIDERAPLDTNPVRKYEAAFIIGTFGRVRFLVEAATNREAEAKAEKMRLKLLKHPELCCGLVSLESVKLITGGESHE